MQGKKLGTIINAKKIPEKIYFSSKKISANPPLVSVLVCTYNAEKFIKPTIKSIIDQTYKNLEILILDNASADNTFKILNNFQKKDKRIKIFKSEKNLGAYVGLNYLLDKSKGKYIAINDHDDIWRKDKTEKQVLFLEQNKSFVGCGGLAILFFERSKSFFLEKLRKNQHIVNHTSLIYRNSKKYRYNTSIKYKTDSYFMEKILCRKSQIFLFNDYLIISRIRADNQNLRKKMRNFDNVFSTYKITKNLKMLLKGIVFIMLPREIDYLLAKIFWSEKSIKPEELKHYSFTSLSLG